MLSNESTKADDRHKVGTEPLGVKIVWGQTIPGPVTIL